MATHIRWCTVKENFPTDGTNREAPYDDAGLVDLDEYVSAFYGDNADVFKVFADADTSTSWTRTLAKIAAELLDQVKRSLFTDGLRFFENSQLFLGWRWRP